MTPFNLFFWRKPKRPAPPKKGEIGKADKTRQELSGRREKLLYEAMELDDEIQRLFNKYKEEESGLLKTELMRSLTIKRAEYESLESRLAKIGEAELGMTRRSAFLQSFLDLERLEELQSERRVRERRAAIYTDKVIGLTEMRAERSERAESLERETIEKLEAEDRARERKAELKAARERREEMERLEKAARERLEADDVGGESDAEEAASNKRAPAREDNDGRLIAEDGAQ